jgi:tryptophan 2,3-dioxygenase
MEIDVELKQALESLAESRKHTGQSLGQILRGMSKQQTLTYWDYIHQDTLLSLQTTKTNYPDEKLFLIYHQIVELYFKLIIHELNNLVDTPFPCLDSWYKHIGRACQNLQIVLSSFDTISDQLEMSEFSEFRLALAPASGFQSFQFRFIELQCTPLENLMSSEAKFKHCRDTDLAEAYQHIYWKSAGRDLKTNEKSHMLVEFENKFDAKLLNTAHNYVSKNVWNLYQTQPLEIQADTVLQNMLRELDFNFNVNWSLKHYKLAAKHLRGNGSVDAYSTGGTNWRKFLPPKNQKISFFPGLWSNEERSDWGVNQNLG